MAIKPIYLGPAIGNPLLPLAVALAKTVEKRSTFAQYASRCYSSEGGTIIAKKRGGSNDVRVYITPRYWGWNDFVEEPIGSTIYDTRVTEPHALPFYSYKPDFRKVLLLPSIAALRVGPIVPLPVPNDDGTWRAEIKRPATGIRTLPNLPGYQLMQEYVVWDSVGGGEIGIYPAHDKTTVVLTEGDINLQYWDDVLKRTVKLLPSFVSDKKGVVFYWLVATETRNASGSKFYEQLASNDSRSGEDLSMTTNYEVKLYSAARQQDGPVVIKSVVVLQGARTTGKHEEHRNDYDQYPHIDTDEYRGTIAVDSEDLMSDALPVPMRAEEYFSSGWPGFPHFDRPYKSFLSQFIGGIVGFKTTTKKGDWVYRVSETHLSFIPDKPPESSTETAVTRTLSCTYRYESQSFVVARGDVISNRVSVSLDPPFVVLPPLDASGYSFEHLSYEGWLPTLQSISFSTPVMIRDKKAVGLLLTRQVSFRFEGDFKYANLWGTWTRTGAEEGRERRVYAIVVDSEEFSGGISICEVFPLDFEQDSSRYENVVAFLDRGEVAFSAFPAFQIQDDWAAVGGEQVKRRSLNRVRQDGGEVFLSPWNPLS